MKPVGNAFQNIDLSDWIDYRVETHPHLDVGKPEFHSPDRWTHGAGIVDVHPD
jgi:hypothetical protein